MAKHTILSNWIKSELVHLKNRVYYRSYRNALPSHLRNDDIYLVEFPKSGITWLSFLLTNINLEMSGMERYATFYNLDQYVYDISPSTNRTPPISPLHSFPGFRLLKSHALYNPFYRNVVLLIRNPFDVMVSYFHYIQTKQNHHNSIDQFVHDKDYGILTWVKHMSSWLDTPTNRDSQRIHLIKYEDIKSDAIYELEKLYRNWGLKIPPKIIKNAITKSNLQNMRLDRAFFLKNHPLIDGEFVRKGTVGGFSEEMSEETIEFIKYYARVFIERFWPEYL